MRVHHSNRMEALAAILAELLRADPGEPLAPEHVVVPHRTVGRWLSLELARELGIAANLSFDLPAGFAWSVMRSAVPDLPREHGFSPDRLRWRIHDVLPAFAAGDREGGAVRRYLADGDPRKRFELADRLARVFDRCMVYRPDWIRAWDGGDAPSWQARLWQRVVAEEEGSATHWVAVIDAFRAALRDGFGKGGRGKDGLGRGARLPRCPRRASFFAVTSLSPSYLDVLSGIGEVVEIDLFVLNPCREYWGDVYSRREIGRRADGADPGERYLTEGNELLAAWGRAGRDTVDSLVEIAGDAEEGRFVRPAGARRLAAIQRDVLDLRLAAEGRSAEADTHTETGGERDGAPARDDSVEVHVCHSPVREAEVLHDRLLGLFDAHPDLAPADVLVLTPDLERYGPAVEAVFGAAGRIPLHVARRRSAPSPAVRAFLDLLTMRRSRFTAEAVLAPLDTEAVRARFGVREPDLPAIRGWVRDAGIRWGVDAAHREAEGLPASGEHAWRQGLRRLLLGYAVPDRNDLVAGFVPCPLRVGGFDTGAEEGALLGRFVTYCEQVFGLRSRLAGERSPGEWARVLREEIGRFFAEGGATASVGGAAAPGIASGTSAGNAIGGSTPAAVPAPAADEVAELRGLVRSFEREAARCVSPIGFEVVPHVLCELADAPPREPVRLADAVTVASLSPGQVFPAEVVCVIGLDDGAFPRSPSFPTFDLVASGPARRGDRDVRHEDRFVFLEALLAARRAFLVSHTGRGQRDDAPSPPATVVDELVDYLAQRFPGAPPVVRHPLQPFSPRYFSHAGRTASGPEAKDRRNADGTDGVGGPGGEGGPGRPAGDGELFSYSEGMCEAARSLVSGTAKSAPPARFEAAVPEPPEPAGRPCHVGLADLLAFFANPTRWFLRERLGMRLELDDAGLDEEEPFDLDPLDRHRLRSEVLERMRAGVPRRRDEDLQRGSGRLPQAALGGILHERVWGEMEGFHRLLDRYRDALEAAPVEIDLDLGGCRVTGAVENAGPDGLVWWRPGRLRARDRIEVRLRQLALAAAGRGPVGAMAFSIEKGAAKTTSFSAPEDACEQLLAWLRAWEQGRSAALSFFPETSLAYAKAVADGKDRLTALANAHDAWFGGSGSWSRDGEVAHDPWLQLVYDDRDPLTGGFETLAADLLVPLAEAAR